jgi:hypothetical protein
MFWIHKIVFMALEGKASMRAIDTSMDSIMSLKNSGEPDTTTTTEV